MGRRYMFRGLHIHDIPRLRKRENRGVELFVDCYGDAEAAGSLEVYLSEALDYPFEAFWRDGPVGERERITVLALSDEWDDHTGLHFVVDAGEGDDLAPAYQIYAAKRGRNATVLDDYRAWWPYELVDDEDDE